MAIERTMSTRQSWSTWAGTIENIEKIGNLAEDCFEIRKKSLVAALMPEGGEGLSAHDEYERKDMRTRLSWPRLRITLSPPLVLWRRSVGI